MKSNIDRPARLMLGEPVFSLRPWQPEFGDPAVPARVLGVAVTRRLLRSADPPAALVQLADRRYALTGSVLMVGTPRQLAGYLRRRAAPPNAGSGDAWVGRVLGVLAEYRATRPAADLAR